MAGTISLSAYYGQNALFRNNGNGTFTEVTKEAGLLQDRLRWNSGCTFLDYDRDGNLDLFVGNYIDLDLKTAPMPEMQTAPTRAFRSPVDHRASRAARTFSTTTTATARLPM